MTIGNLASTPRTAALSSQAALRQYVSLEREYDYIVDEMDGAVPEGLLGTLFRIGPGKFEMGESRLHTIFEGDGMVSRFIFDGTQNIRYTNRYVRTDQFRKGLSNGRLPEHGPENPVKGRKLQTLTRLRNVANTNIIPLAGEMLACWEFGNPHRMDPDTLETLGAEDFDGALGYLGAFSAHPKWDAETGEMFNFGLDFLPTPRLRCYRKTPTGKVEQINSVTLWDMGWNHDFALTKKYLVFLLDPFRIPNPIKLARTGSLAKALKYQFEDTYSKIVLVPRDGSRPRIIDYDAQLHIHMTNAYEDGSDTVFEFPRYTDVDSFSSIRLTTTGPTQGGPLANIMRWPTSHLVRLRVSPSGRVTEEVLTPDNAIEFPQFDWRRSNLRHTVTYSTASRVKDVSHYDGIGKFDHAKETATFWHRDDWAFGEPLFVPRSKIGAEDDGWLLTLSQNLLTHRSQLSIFDARDVEVGPICTLYLKHHVPVGFHGTFTSRVAMPQGLRG
ncbi:putative dioxygenase [Gordonia effusa NBRC 100432]|uniref:Dioxygenase n=1 Tax=Gordonia effusa NBRC 100432 TaxID=1077974 RepID=H0R016_9ACTN|nr:carotenoid oxygenase family protein [Gordonia effusa]GAB18417.1 putative dioxygenase [Gordonia effusa NBRC 100432]